MIYLEVLSGLPRPFLDWQWLENVRIDSRFPLPPSYLEWAREYGYGRALGLFIMYAPNPNHPDSVLIQGEKVRGFIRLAIEGNYLDYEPDGSKELARQLFPFVMGENGDYFAWHLQAPVVGADDRPEYPIYCLAPRMAGIRSVARDLDHLMLRLTSIEVKEVLGPGYSRLPKTFERLDQALARPPGDK